MEPPHQEIISFNKVGHGWEGKQIPIAVSLGMLVYWVSALSEAFHNSW